MRIDDLMHRFAALPGARVGRGPAHPERPDPSIGDAVDDFLRQYPALTHDQGYVDFLRRYGGAAIENEERRQIVDILGFTDASTEMLDMDGPVVDSDGFLMFAQCVYHVAQDTQEHDFAFGTRPGRDPGVYRLYAAASQPQTLAAEGRGDRWEATNEDFLAWLDRIVRAEGMLPPA